MSVVEFSDQQQNRALETIERWIKEPPSTGNSRVFTITPMIAAHLLDRYNTDNRPAKPGKIKVYADDLIEDRWWLTGDTIKFSTKGLLRDGQNRLKAVVAADVPMTTHIVFGVADEAFKVMDRGKNRNPSDILAIAGYSYTTALSQAVRWAELISKDEVRSRRSFEPQEVLRLLKETYDTRSPTLSALVPEAVRIYQTSQQPAGMVGALLWHIHRANPRKAAAFQNAWQSGYYGGEFKPLARLQKRVVALHSLTHGRVHDVVRMAMLVKAWNLYVNGAKGRRDEDLDWSPSAGDFPKIEG